MKLAQAIDVVKGLALDVALKPPGFQIISKISSLRTKRRNDRLEYQTVGFVPTMGALHQGHIALIRQAARENNRVYVSIYVNPAQFGVNEDFSSYPRQFAADTLKLNQLVQEFSDDHKLGQITTVFAPRTEEMYPFLQRTSEADDLGSFVTITPLSTLLEGASRPVFFQGVATVCMKLLNIVQPEKVYLGQKDVQQSLVIKRMVEEFHLDTEVCVCPTVREPDGLAMSSRNVYLGKRRRSVAIVLLDALKAMEISFGSGERKSSRLLAAGLEVTSRVLEQQRSLLPSKRAMFEVDYLSIGHPTTMTELDEVDSTDGAIISGAIKMLPVEDPQTGEDVGSGHGKSVVRLIDNIRVTMLHAKLEEGKHQRELKAKGIFIRA